MLGNILLPNEFILHLLCTVLFRLSRHTKTLTFYSKFPYKFQFYTHMRTTPYRIAAVYCRNPNSASCTLRSTTAGGAPSLAITTASAQRVSTPERSNPSLLRSLR